MAQIIPRKQISTHGRLCNRTTKTLYLVLEPASVTQYPAVIRPGECVQFKQEGCPHGYVMYKIEAEKRNWVVAWINGNGSGNLALTGTVPHGTPFDWDSIKKELEKSQNGAVECPRKDYRTTVTINQLNPAELEATIAEECRA